MQVPNAVRQALEQGAALAISISGGKDSHAMIRMLPSWFRAQGYTGELYALHADLGRMEWTQTPEIIQQHATTAEIPLVVVRWKDGDLVDRIERRMHQLAGTGKPFWPSSQSRYCTSDLKRGPIDIYLRNHHPAGSGIVCAIGLRAQESPNRAKQPVVAERKSVHTQSRLALNWLPIHEYTESQVWDVCGHSQEEIDLRRFQYACGLHDVALDGWTGHPAYIYGSTRLSCALCVLASRNDLTVGARHNPDLHRHLIQLEQIGGSTFQDKFSLGDIHV
jgi:3'-phosphoadenosine 5'-phosphosulfate sulfotransferase (PAPS reductase)/FAD synthetase